MSCQRRGKGEKGENMYVCICMYVCMYVCIYVCTVEYSRQIDRYFY